MHLCYLLLLTTASMITPFVIATTTVPTEIAAAAGFVLDSLKEINDSGIYCESLQLHSIHEAKVVDGLFHTCMLLTVELSSSNFASGNETELFEMIAMKRKPGEVRGDKDVAPERVTKWHSYAIDRFPKMKKGAIEDALRRKVETTIRRNKKIRREVLI